jgi:DNA polymerase III alpha subunit
MELDKHGIAIFNEDEIFKAIYAGKISNLSEITTDNPEITSKIAGAISANYDAFASLNRYKESTLTIDEFDKQNQSNWFMPEEYKNMDIEEFLVHNCPEQNYSRLVQELELFRQHNMIEVLKYLKYLVDTMRKNKIVWGVGRGSSVASYCLFLIGVHKIDSVKYNLDITEFLR